MIIIFKFSISFSKWKKPFTARWPRILPKRLFFRFFFILISPSFWFPRRMPFKVFINDLIRKKIYDRISKNYFWPKPRPFSALVWSVVTIGGRSSRRPRMRRCAPTSSKKMMSENFSKIKSQKLFDKRN